MTTLVVYGEEVPRELIAELIEDGMKPEEITIEFLETLLYYEHLDSRE